MSIKAEQKQKSHATILDSVSRLLREKGIAGTSVAETMKGAGLTVGGFYAHFDSKEKLIDAAIARTGAEMRARLFSRLDEKPKQKRAEIVLKRYLSAAHRDQNALGCPMPAVAGEVATTAGEHHAALAAEVELLASELAALLPAATRSLATGLVALMVGGLTLSRAVQGTELSDEVLRACRALGQLATEES